MAAAGTTCPAEFKTNFAKFADKGNAITTRGLTKWFKDTSSFNKKITSNSLDICFSKHKSKGQNNVTCDQAWAIVQDLEKQSAGIVAKLSGSAVSKDLKSGTTKQSKSGNVEGMTDTSKYTGAHKERFDESGQGKGLEGREDKVENTGYVGEYKGEGSHGKK